MDILFLLVPLALLLVAVIIGIMAWAVNDGQYDDMETPGHAILMDDDGGAPDEAVRMKLDLHQGEKFSDIR